ncbi:uncharacterized protein [Rutidosis leptorrhynchoides]|uniref:uncharacterized protein n=1 Tax=Rutidosis leptorrhynchoides TaxID=125765 RepID=UPI003A9911D5
MSGLKINLSKCTLYGIGGVSRSENENFALTLGCKGHLPILYMGLPVGSRMNKLNDWKPIIEKFRIRFAEWKARSMSFGGRLTLIKSVLTSLPLYNFSLFRAPTCVINCLESLRRKFFWGGAGEVNKWLGSKGMKFLFLMSRGFKCGFVEGKKLGFNV